MDLIPSVEKEQPTTKVDGLAQEMNKLQGLKKSAMELESQYSTLLPKINPRLITEVLKVQRESPNKIPIFTLEVFTKKVGEGGIDCDIVKEHIWNTTGKMPAIYDNGTHYITNQRLTLETLKRLNDFEHVLKVTGEYSGDGYASNIPAHECSMVLKNIRREEKGEPLLKKEQRGEEKLLVLRTVIFTIIGIAGAVALGGFVISGGAIPNTHTNDVAFISYLEQEPGMLYGYVGGPNMGLPAIGASVIASNSETGYTSNSVISVDGKYFLDLLPGKYNLLIAFPDGTSQTHDDVVIKRGTASEMNIMY